MKWQEHVYAGAGGRAWEILPDRMDNAPASLLSVHLGTWIINAAWAHPVWPQYALALVSLAEAPGVPPAKKHRGDVTHELMLFALDPKRGLSPDGRVDADVGLPLLHPMNHGYQFAADKDAAARRRAINLVEAIADGTLNPDTDARSAWHALFTDAVPLVKSALELHEDGNGFGANGQTGVSDA